jgi:hypothetical protein
MRTEKPLGEDPVKVSDHVWQIVGWPNIGIVVGEKATDDRVGVRSLRKCTTFRDR